ncbi:MAG: DUF7793 family protein [Bacteroidia bacterium]
MTVLVGNTFENNKYKIAWLPELKTVEFYMKDQELDRDDVMEMHKHTLEITKGEKYANIFSAQDFFSISTEGREEGAKPYYSENLIVQALVVKNLAQRLLGNFVMKFNNPKKETRLFSSVEEARKWVAVKIKEYEAKQKNRDTLAARSDFPQ